MIQNLRDKLYTTVVGSFPYRVDKSLIGEPDWKKTDLIRETSQLALDLQLDCGIDFPSDGQFFDMITMYLEPLKRSGLVDEKGRLSDGSIPDKHPSTNLETDLLEQCIKRGAQGIRVPITGPFTLGYRVKGSKKSVVEEVDPDGLLLLGETIKKFSKTFDRSLSGSILSVDEPVLPFVKDSFGEGFIRDVLDDIFGSIKKNHTSMHVCGSIASIKDLSLQIDVDILDHEFQGTDNKGVYSGRDLEKNNKMLSFGLVNSNPRQVFSKGRSPIVENPSEVEATARLAIKKYGKENLLFSPDCGFAGWKSIKQPENDKWEIISNKLCTMVNARNHFTQKD